METLVRRIVVDVVTSHAENAGTEAPVFLGLGGREFRLDLVLGPGFERGADATFHLGQDANVRHPERNDPRLGIPITIADVLANRAYLRILPRNERDDWNVASVAVRVHTEFERRAIRYAALDEPGETAWLGLTGSTLLHLRQGPLDRLDLQQS